MASCLMSIIFSTMFGALPYTETVGQTQFQEANSQSKISIRASSDPSYHGIDGNRESNRSLLIDGTIYHGVRQDTDFTVVDCFASKDNQFCLPSWIIAASAKSGSSALWQYLCDNVGSKCSEKEIHYSGQPVVSYIKNNMGQDPNFGSGNMLPERAMPFLNDFITRNSNTKFIVLLPNPIDWVYAVWHFWCNPLFDGHDCTSWTSRAENKTARTPENFEMLLEKYCVGKDECFASGWQNWETAEGFLESIPNHRLLIIRSEKLAEDTPGTLRELWEFLGLPSRLRHPDIVNKAFNTGRSNGIQSHEEITNALGKSYAPMSQRSRDILCNVTDYWTRLSYFVNKYQIQIHPVDLEACHK